MIFVGIDVGIKGGIAVLDDDNEIVGLTRMPLKKYSYTEKSKPFNIVDIDRLRQFLLPICFSKEVSIAMERLFVMKSVGKGAITSGINYGRVWATLEMLNSDNVDIRIFGHASNWQKPIMVNYLGCDTYEDTKEASIEIASKLYGRDTLIPAGCRVPQDGLADALLIARFLLDEYIENK